MRNRLFFVPLLAFVAAQAAPGFKQGVPFPAFEGWAKGSAAPGMAFKEAKDEAEAYVALYKATSGAETLTLRLEGAGKFEGLASGATRFTWKGLEAQFLASTKGGPTLIAVKYGDSKATLSVTFTASPKTRTQADMEKILRGLKPEKILK